MKVWPLLVTARQPVWLRMLLTVAFAVGSSAIAGSGYDYRIFLTWMIGYLILTFVPWVIVRNLPEGHPARDILAEHEQLDRRYLVYRFREAFWFNGGLLVALLFHHSLAFQSNCSLCVVAMVGMLIGLAAMIIWHFKCRKIPAARAS